MDYAVRHQREPSAAGQAWIQPDVDAFPPIGDYGLVGDCRTAALVSRTGSVEWLCLSHFSGPALFAALLDREKGGRFAIRPTRPFRVTRRYKGHSLVLETVFSTDQGSVSLTDAMPIPGRTESRRMLQPQRELVRIVTGVSGQVEMEVLFQPRPQFGRARVHLRDRRNLGWYCQYRNEMFNMLSTVRLQASEDRTQAYGRFRVAAGQREHFSLSYVKGDVGVITPLGDAAEERVAVTEQWWNEWADRCRYAGPYRDAVVRSAVTLKALTYSLSGAVVAAPTTSLPENVGGSKNWDYRYCWLRDASLTLQVFMDLGYEDEGRAFLGWLLHATRLTWPRLQVLYSIYGDDRIPETELKHFSGYCQSRPVRVGNGAWNQLQLDVYGSVVMAAYEYVRRGGSIDASEARMLKGLGNTVCRLWREPDNGIWEIRGGRRHHTYSKLQCWLALDRLVKLHDAGHVKVRRKKFVRERDAIRQAVDEHGYNQRGNYYAAVFGDTALDASALLASRYGYLAPDDPRMIGTFNAIDRDLGVGNGLLLRYRHGFDRTGEPESAFGICCFWAVEYLAQAGRVEEAERRFEQLLEYSNDLGLYAEEIHVDSGTAVGNFPQAFTHVGLVDAALAIAEAH